MKVKAILAPERTSYHQPEVVERARDIRTGRNRSQENPASN
jgi:hypothetical protein